MRPSPFPDDCWLPDGVRAEIAGIPVLDGMIYVGTALPADSGGQPDPALIDPTLPVDHHHPDLRGESMDYWPSYSRISPAARAAYLQWLAAGRTDPDAYIGYVFLYFYGLERRLLVDSRTSAIALVERWSLLAEIRRLLSIYGTDGSFGGYARLLLDAMTVASPDAEIGVAPAPTGEWSAGLPMRTRIALARLSAERTPIPADWALAWVTQLPDTYLRTPATRCIGMFVRVFEIHYRERYGDGVVLRPGTRPLAAQYRPASSGIAPWSVEDNQLREVGDQAGAITVLRQIVDRATTDLEPYSRYLGRHPNGAGDSAAVALLPGSLPVPDDSAAGGLWSWAVRRLGDAPHAVVPVTELVQHWPDAPSTGKMGKADLLVLAQLLDRRAIGIEPDTRFGGTPSAADKPLVLFHRADQQVQAPNPAYAIAVATVNLGMLVAAADGVVLDAELDVLRAALAPLDLSADERLRLEAHAALIGTNPPTPAVLRRRLAGLPEASRDEAGRLLIAIASIDGTITADEVRSLERLFGDIGLDSSKIYSTLHSAAVTDTTRTDVVTIHTSDAPAARTPLPTIDIAAPSGLTLDPGVLAAKRAESIRAAAQLADIFAEDEDVAEVDETVDPAPAVASVAGMDEHHSRLLHLLAARDSWQRGEVEQLTAELGLLTDGALEVLNEAAYDCAGSPLWEGTDLLRIDHDIAEDMRE
jgi:tellurite resistance protein